jgi:hypothetical protein
MKTLENHLDCHCGPFTVVIVGIGYVKNKTHVYIYNSEVGAWSEAAFARHSCGSIDRSVRSTVVKNGHNLSYNTEKQDGMALCNQW